MGCVPKSWKGMRSMHVVKLETTRSEQQLHVYMDMVSLSVFVPSLVRLHN